MSDASEILEIYAPYVEHTAISFEYEVPDITEFEERIRKITARFPYLVAEENGRIIGFCYANEFRTRKAYEKNVETSIYIDKRNRRSGIGRVLYTELELRLREMGIRNMYACIAYPEREDEYLTKDSVKFHEKMGFEQCGFFRLCGCKFDRWYHMVYMEKIIAEDNYRR